MKIRNGFVSNSSSSSFCIYGTTISKYEIQELAKAAGQDQYDYLEYLLENSFCESNYDGYEYYYIGQSLLNLKNDETGGQFKDRTKEELIKLFPNEKLEFSTYLETVKRKN